MLKNHIVQLHHIGIPVSSMDEAKEFFQKLGAKIYFEKKEIEDGKNHEIVIFDYYGTKIEIYEREEIAGKPGAIDHIAFEIHDIDKMYETCKKEGFTFFEDCADGPQETKYWPTKVRWFIVMGPGNVKVEFSELYPADE